LSGTAAGSSRSVVVAGFAASGREQRAKKQTEAGCVTHRFHDPYRIALPDRARIRGFFLEIDA
jgi:hypothetical protein